MFQLPAGWLWEVAPHRPHFADGLYDKSVIGTTAVDIFNSSVSIVGNMVEIQIPSNFSYGVRYQMSMDIGVVRFASDAGGYQGMIYREPEAGEWWFKVSDQYHTSTYVVSRRGRGQGAEGWGKCKPCRLFHHCLSQAAV